MIFLGFLYLEKGGGGFKESKVKKRKEKKNFSIYLKIDRCEKKDQK